MALGVGALAGIGLLWGGVTVYGVLVLMSVEHRRWGLSFHLVAAAESFLAFVPISVLAGSALTKRCTPRTRLAPLLRTTQMPETLYLGQAAFARCAGAGQGLGKSGGVRVVYFTRTVAEEIVLLALYAKSTIDNLTGAKLKEIRRVLED